MLFRTLRTSRGYGKFVRNRAAIIALAVITGYFILAGWIVATEVVQWVGTDVARWVHRTSGPGAPAAPSSAPGADAASHDHDWWNLENDPILGLLLASSVEKRVGPKWVSGFFLAPDLARREDHLYSAYELADRGLKAVDALAARTGGSVTPEQAREVLAREEFGFAERQVANLPLAELKSLRDQAGATLAQLQGLKKRREALAKAEKALVGIGDLEREARTLPADAAPEQVKAALDNLGAAVEELGYVIEDYSALPPLDGAGDGAPADPLAAISADPFRDAGDALRADKPPAPSAIVLPTEAMDRVRAALPKVREAISAPLARALDQAEPIINRLMPWPTGFARVLYDFKLALGTNSSGQSIMIASLYSAKIAIQIGCIVALAAVLIGAMLGSAAGFFGGIVDHLVTWLYSTLSALPQLVLLGVIAFMFLNSSVEKTLIPVYVALTGTFWISTCRVVRGEVLKLKELEYVQAGKAIGFGRVYILTRHVLPNTMHLLFINFSLLFIGAVKSEVVLTFLGLGIKDGASWGRMIHAASSEVPSGFFWQIGAATFFMLVLVLAFNILSDALQDAFDPKHVG